MILNWTFLFISHPFWSFLSMCKNKFLPPLNDGLRADRMRNHSVSSQSINLSGINFRFQMLLKDLLWGKHRGGKHIMGGGREGGVLGCSIKARTGVFHHMVRAGTNGRPILTHHTMRTCIVSSKCPIRSVLQNMQATYLYIFHIRGWTYCDHQTEIDSTVTYNLHSQSQN